MKHRSTASLLFCILLLSACDDSSGTKQKYSFVNISVCATHACAIDNNTWAITCFGNCGHSGACDVPEIPVKSFSVGDFSTCLIREDDSSILCVGNMAAHTPPTGTFERVRTGDDTFACALRSDGTIACWGDEYEGRTQPPAGTFWGLDCGSYGCCAIATDTGTLSCWGADDYGQASPPAGEFRAVTVGLATACGLQDTEWVSGTTTCWGSDFQGIDLAPAGSWMSLSMGSGGGCALNRGGGGRLECWGYPDIANIPEDIDISQVSAVDVGGGAAGTNVCVVNGPGTVQCWGSGTYYWEIPR